MPYSVTPLIESSSADSLEAIQRLPSGHRLMPVSRGRSLCSSAVTRRHLIPGKVMFRFSLPSTESFVLGYNTWVTIQFHRVASVWDAYPLIRPRCFGTIPSTPPWHGSRKDRSLKISGSHLTDNQCLTSNQRQE